MKNHSRIFFLLMSSFILLTISCTNTKQVDSPKPKGYYRIELPPHAYQQLDTVFPFCFPYSKYATYQFKQQPNGDYWIYINYKRFNADLNITYAALNKDLRERIIEEDRIVSFHYKVADDVEFSIISDAASNIFGQIYDIKGMKVATPISFWLTDSSNHYLRGALYFNNPPNNDSLQPVIEYIREDILEMINGFEWK